VIGIALQWIGGILIALGFFIPHHSRSFIRHQCRYIGPTVGATVTHECWLGQHREQIIGLSVAVGGLILLLVGRRLAKRAGLD
jgi:hypothetical protein